MGQIEEHIYYIRGMHCASCEVVIEKKLLSFNSIKSVEVSIQSGTAVVEYEHELPNIGKLNHIFSRLGYTFFNHLPKQNEAESEKNSSWTAYIWPILIVIALFVIIPRTRLATLVSVTSSSSLPTFFVFGLLAGISSCAALVGGLVLSMSKQWAQLYSHESSTVKKLEPHLLFSIGRLVSYALLGGLFGLLGSTFKLSPTTFSILVVIISAVMILLGLQMLGVKALQKFQISAPKGLTRYIADESHFKGKYMPSILGALTFFLPCGFTITAQSLALISGSFWQGSLIMLTFALGTLPMLAVIGFSSVKFLSSAESSAKFLRVAGTIVVFFALFNINSQMNILGLPSLNDLKVNSAPASSSGQGVAASEGDLPPIVDGKQVVKMEATSLRYTPDTIKVRAEIPVRWEIKDNGTSGCTNAIISKGLFSDSIALTNGQTSVKEFTPSKPGKYKFSCWMGMVSGTIEVVADNSSSSNSPKSNLGSNGLTAGVGVADAAGSSSIVPSGASGCGCGGGAK